MTAQPDQHFQSMMLALNQPRPNDVLCGRSKASFHHEGNQRFRALIGEHAVTYKMAPTKKQKMQVVLLVAKTVVARGGRFLVHDKNGDWVDGGIRTGKKKTGHAFRDALRGRVKCISQMMKDNIHNSATNAMFDDFLSDDSSGVYSESSEEHEFEEIINTVIAQDPHAKIIASFDFEDVNKVSPAKNGQHGHAPIEPPKEWRNLKMDRQMGMEVASDPLDLFITDYITSKDKYF